MKTANPALADFLATNRQFFIADLLEVSTTLGTTFYATSGTQPFTVNFPDGDPPSVNVWHDRGDFDYLNTVLGFTRGKTAMRCGLQVDTLDLTLWDKGGATVGGIGLIQAAANGLFDGADVTLMRLYMPTYGDTSLGPVWLFGGQIAEQDVSQNSVKCTVKSGIQKLDKQMPRNIGQPGCVNTVYDTACGVNQTTYTVTANCSVETDDLYSTTFSSGGAPQADHYFDQGFILCTAGRNAGAKRTVKEWLSHVAYLHRPWNFAPLVGETFQLVPGCDGTLGAQGCPKFSNTPRFRGMPFIPVPENMIP